MRIDTPFSENLLEIQAFYQNCNDWNISVSRYKIYIYRGPFVGQLADNMVAWVVQQRNNSLLRTTTN